MALEPVDEAHALQIQAGTLGRKAGHAFEDQITLEINNLAYPRQVAMVRGKHLFSGDPALVLLDYIAHYFDKKSIYSARAISTGALATSEAGRKWLSINGANISRCKSDIIVTLNFTADRETTIGVSTKQCNNKTPTNAQLYFTTARGFVKLLRDNGIAVSETALLELRKFCGDQGFRPADFGLKRPGRTTDPRRFFWEELGSEARQEWEKIFSECQDKITRLLLQKAYIDDSFVPDFLVHKTKSATSWTATEAAIYSIEELVKLSRRYQGFATRPYAVKKGSYPDPPGVSHLAPRFGIVQMQRGGQAQHPEQLQFNLAAGYFYLLEKI
jgi:hypothetical protein